MLASGGSEAGVATWPHCGNFEETSIESASAQTSDFRDMRTLLAASGDADADFLPETDTCLPHHIRRGGRPTNPVPNGRSPSSRRLTLGEPDSILLGMASCGLTAARLRFSL